MRIANPQQYIDVDPTTAMLCGFQLSVTDGGREAWGYVYKDGTEIGPVRLAYQDRLGRWQAEGTARYEAPDPTIMKQIQEVLDLARFGF